MSSSVIIRAADGLEFILQSMYLYLEDTVSLEKPITFNEAIEAISEVVQAYEPFHLALIPDKDGHFFFHRINIDKTSLPIEERPWNPNPDTIVKCEPLQVAPGNPLYRIFLSLCDDKKHATIGIAVSHSICDGRTLANYLAVVRSALPCTKKYPVPKNCSLGGFGQLCNYNINPEECKTLPPTISDLRKHRIIPDAEPSVTVCELNKFPLEPIRAYCKAHNVGIQAVLMAAMYRSLCIFGKIGADDVIYGNVIVDTRYHAVAKPELRQRDFFCGANTCFAEMKGTCGDDIDKDILLCAEAAKKAASTNDAVIFTVVAGQIIDKDTLAMTFPVGLPNMVESPVFTGSNIGRVNCTDPRFMVLLPSSLQFTLPLYGVQSETHLHTTLIYPEKADLELLKITREQIRLVINHISN